MSATVLYMSISLDGGRQDVLVHGARIAQLALAAGVLVTHIQYRAQRHGS